MSKKKGRVKDTAISVVLCTKGDGKKRDCRQWTSQGSCSKGAKCAFKQDDKTEEREKAINDSEYQVGQNVDSPIPKLEASNKTGTCPAKRDDRTSLIHFARRRVACKTRNAVTGTIRSAFFPQERSMQSRHDVALGSSQ